MSAFSISVIIPTYKRTNDLNRCLHALLCQTRQADELLVVVREADSDSIALVEQLADAYPVIKQVQVTESGQVAALNAGLDAASGDLIAITDDDTVPRTDWLLRIEARFAADSRLGGVGGRDWVHHNGFVERGCRSKVGLVQWFGRIVGNHHLGYGDARGADLLKGANMSYRRSAVGSLRFDTALKGAGAQVFNDMDFSMGVKGAGWKLLYDPAVAVDHYPGSRFDDDQRNQWNAQAITNMAHNEAYVIRKHLSAFRWLMYACYTDAVGSSSSPGLLKWLKLLTAEPRLATRKWAAAMQGRKEGARTWRKLNKRSGSAVNGAAGSQGTAAIKVGVVMPLGDLRGGAEAMLLHLLQAHKGSELTYTLMFMEDGPLVQKAAALGYDVKVIHPGKLRQIGRYVSTVRSLYGWIKEENISVVLSWMSKAHLYAGPAAWLGRVPAVWYQHGMPHNNLMESLIAAIPARAVMCPSQWIKEAENRLSPKLHTVVVHPSVDLERFTPAAVPPVHEVRSRLGLPADRLIVGIVARLQRWKGIHTFLDAAALVLKEQPDVEFVIVGGSHYSETDYPGELERQAEQAGIGSRVRFAGHQPDTASWIQAFDIAVHCSDKEPFGMVVIESMAMGKPVIASKAGGPLEIITHGVDGLLVVPGNANQLASAIKLLVDHERCRARLSRAGLERAKVFSKERLAAETARLLVSMTIKESRELQHDYTAPSYSRK